MITKPQADEYAPFYANYVKLAASKGEDVLHTLTQLKDHTFRLISELPAEKGEYAYAEGKWTIKKVLLHLMDAERVFAYRILCFSRKDPNALPGFNQTYYIDNASLSGRTLNDLAQEFRVLRESNLYLFRSLSDEQLSCFGTASGHVISVKALLYITAGHELHHLNILKERYQVIAS